MKLLILDCSHFEYKLDHKTSVGENIAASESSGIYTDPLVIFTAVEAQDSEEVIGLAAKDITKIALKNKSRVVIVNPFAHLSSHLAKADKAITFLAMLTTELQKCNGFKTIKSVFGWYKQFRIDVKGHENSQIYREY